jgi:hypothetical protein
MTRCPECGGCENTGERPCPGCEVQQILDEDVDWEPCDHEHSEWCEDDDGRFDRCDHQHCFNCGGCGCAGYCDDTSTYNLRPPAETGGAR